jgi:hypothetical protein
MLVGANVYEGRGWHRIAKGLDDVMCGLFDNLCWCRIRDLGVFGKKIDGVYDAFRLRFVSEDSVAAIMWSWAGPRYHPSVASGSHVCLCPDFSWIRTLVPGGAMGVRLKSNVPSRAVYAEMRGLRRDGRKRFSVVCAWLVSLSQRC